MSRRHSRGAMAVIVGTRPEVVKIAPVLKAMIQSGLPFNFIHAGQHSDYRLAGQFIRELDLPEPNVRFRFHASYPAEQTARMMILLERFLVGQRPPLVLIQGDTNTMLASALAAFKQQIPVAHIEAGLRSYDVRMPEEHNRRMVDHASSFLFAPTRNARKNLESENIPGRIFVVGNTAIDAVKRYLPSAERTSRITEKLNHDEYLLATFHRAENVDDKKVLAGLVKAMNKAAMPVVLPVHPRLKQKLLDFELYRSLASSRNVQLLPPVGYLDFLVLMKNCIGIVTDSGGLQEEATAPGIAKLVLVARKSTERPEAVRAGFAKVIGIHCDDILRGVRQMLRLKPPRTKRSPFGDGRAGERIVQIVKGICN